MKSMVTYSKEMTTGIKGGNKVKKFSLSLALAMALMLTIGVSVALAAPGDYPPGTQTTSDKYTTTLDSTMGDTDSTSWGLTNGLGNANKTGEGTDVNDGSTLDDVIKNVPGQRTHGEYENDTNSCASCHQTHTASGKKLLFKNGVYNTCTACHDGTLGFYNVFEASNAGTFGGDPANGASVHMATGSMTVAAAPGGDRDSTDTNSWGADFTCASCHAPHGSYSDRLLHYNPNNIGATAPTDASGNPTGGKKIMNATVTKGADGHYTAADADGNAVSGPWLYGYTYGKPKVYWSQIRVKDPATGTFTHKYFDDPTQSWNDVLHVNYRGGYFTDDEGVLAGIADADIQIDVAPATVVKMSQSDLNIPAAQALGLPVTQIDGYEKGISAFCAACHTDYNSNSAQTETGTFSKAFRHKIVQGLKTGMVGEPDAYGNQNATMICLSCHFAHGTDNSLMKDARDVQGASTDVNASSALKRYTNMAVCWKCHVDSKATQLKNNDAIWDKKDAGTAPIY
ncbi:MAG: hypothetical protein CVU89_07985 [Firmicutes bacterium HGW-Firmicutes-14]|nr:MAG: hypothetical protein CVU89_07985 [Firmicutes bacterium HGW-Firmicutes-14]